jgi:regulator of protease activity HflC (stomatin/prohibitin superfamily)
VRKQAQSARLGLEVVDFALLNLHPPIEAGASYLDVINARLDAERRVTEAHGVKQVALVGAETRSASFIATARAERSRRISTALSEVAEFKPVTRTHDDDSLRLRLWIESLENALSDQRLFLVDRTLLDEGGEILLDTRRIENGRLPSIESATPSGVLGDTK